VINAVDAAELHGGECDRERGRTVDVHMFTTDVTLHIWHEGRAGDNGDGKEERCERDGTGTWWKEISVIAQTQG